MAAFTNDESFMQVRPLPQRLSCERSCEEQGGAALGGVASALHDFRAARQRRAPKRQGSNNVESAASDTTCDADLLPHHSEAVDLVPTLKDALDRLWDRPHEVRVAALVLLECISDLEDASLRMLSDSIVRYVQERSEPV